MSSGSGKIERRTEFHWNRLLLQQELQSLKREQSHLKSKAEQRPLTGWESWRLTSIADEMMDLLSKFSGAKVPQETMIVSPRA